MRDSWSQLGQNRLVSFQTFKFVPLVWLHHLMDARKIGDSIVHIFILVAMAVQRMQENMSVDHQSSSVLQNEALLLDFAWERLNTGHFSEVDQCWRLLYAATSLVKSVRLASEEQYLNAIAAADFGLLMGDGIPDQLLQRYAQFCDSLLPAPSKFTESDLVLSVPRSLPNSVPIKTFDELSKWDFIDQFLARAEPVIVRGLNNHWPACRTWKCVFVQHLSDFHSASTTFIEILCRRVVPVEQGSKYTDNDWAQKLMTGSEFFSSLREDQFIKCEVN
ncbi:hypothetical protein COOONC_17369 [Cooperia oncophora]